MPVCIQSDGKVERAAVHIGQHVAEQDRLTHGVRDLDAHEARAGHGRVHANALTCEHARDVILEVRELGDAHTLAGIDLERGTRGPEDPLHDLSLHTELREGLLET